MEPLIWVAILVYILSFYLITRFSRNQVKYHNSKSSTTKASLYDWKVLGIRSRYFQLVAMTSGLVTMGVIAIVKAVL
jgi:hypothetical protein